MGVGLAGGRGRSKFYFSEFRVEVVFGYFVGCCYGNIKNI